MKAKAAAFCPDCGMSMWCGYVDDDPTNVMMCNSTRECPQHGVKYRLPTVELVPVETGEADGLAAAFSSSSHEMRHYVTLRAKDHPALPAGIECQGCVPAYYENWDDGPVMDYVLSGAALKALPFDSRSIPFVTQNHDGSLSYEDGYTVMMDGSVRDAESQKLDNHLRAILNSKDCDEVDRLVCQWRDRIVPSKVDPHNWFISETNDDTAPPAAPLPPATEHDAMADFFSKRTKL